MPTSAQATATRGLFLGFHRAQSADGTAARIELRPETALRHMMALGSSGSGKTVLCKTVVEEFVLKGIPVVCIDPQGDLCSLALAAEDPEALRKHGVDPALARLLHEKADVVVFTPASHKGVALSADPVNIDLAGLKGPEAVRALTSMATMIVSLLGYKLDSDDGEGLVAVMDKALGDLREQGHFPRSLEDFAAHLASLDEQALQPYTRYLSAAKIEQARKKLARLDVGARRMLFHEGLPASVDMLLGRPGSPGALPGRTRVSVIYLNTLTSQEDKEFVVAALCEQLYSWMLRNPSTAPQALFYIDEVAQFIPPVRKPACKDSLQVLFKQARKYGLCCLMATQNPGDVDYKAMAQFGTWAIGRLATVQDRKKVQPAIKSLYPDGTDAVMEELPALKPGEFLLMSPDEAAGARPLRTRRLYTRHETLDEERIEKLADKTARPRFAAAMAALRDSARRNPAVSDRAQAAANRAEYLEDEDANADPELLKLADRLASRPSMTARDFAERAKISDAKARGALKSLVKAGLAREFAEGRQKLYFAPQNGLRPDLGLAGKVKALAPAIVEQRALAIGDSLRKGKLMGLIGAEETVVGANLFYRVLLKLDFQEKVTRVLWKRIFGGSHDEKLGSVFLHPLSLKVLVFSPADGMRLTGDPGRYASEVRDFDGAAEFTEALPGELDFDDDELLKRRPDEEVKAAFKQRFSATPKSIEPLFVPVWRIRLRPSGGTTQRVVTIDALIGKTVDW